MQNKTKGTIGEHKVIVKLLEKDYIVFDNVNDVDGIDLVIAKRDLSKFRHGGKFASIQVKTANSYNKKNKRYTFRFGRNGNVADATVCLTNGDIWIIPKDKIGETGLSIYPKSTRKNSPSFKYKNDWSVLE